MDNILPAVVQALAGDNFTVYAYMRDGTVRLYDMKPMIEKGGVFEPLRDETFFRERLTVLNDTVAWDISGNMDPTECIDIDPFTIAESPVVADPLMIAEKSQRRAPRAAFFLSGMLTIF